MELKVVRHRDLVLGEGESCLVVPVYKKRFPLSSAVLQEQHELVLQTLADKDVLTGGAQECFYLPTPGAAYRGVLVAGLGEADGFDAEVFRRAAGKACALLGQHRVAHVCLDLSYHAELPAEAFLEGLILGQYDFDVYKEKPGDKPAPQKAEQLIVIAPDEADTAALEVELQRAGIVAMAANAARHLANTPANDMTPSTLADFAEGVARESDCECTVLEQGQMAALGMNALLGVARGSAEAPRLIVLQYNHAEDADTVAIVGKGVTFDSGGISIKPSKGMEEMKFDMCGGAAVLGTMLAIAELKPAVNVVCVVPAVENKTGADAQRPGDIVQAYNGKTIEVDNTDAEGRLILADALAYVVDKYKPSAVVDLATLTGACVVALGHYAAGMMGNDDTLAEALREAGEATGERLWPFPLWKDYDKLIEGTHADLCNIGPGGEAGAIIGGAFLQNFVGETPWVHLDIAGTAWGGKHVPHLSEKHATGFGVRLLTNWILNRA